jgi:putative hydrolase of the HAD superfamily
MVPWSNINTVFLDMDGTLLDLHFDNHFWLEHVPQRYGEARGLSFADAKAELLERYRSREGTLEWYCIDHWSRELGLDIALLKEEVHHLIQVHPHVLDFLEAVRATGRRVVLVTNAHQKAIALKMQRTELAGHFDQIVCAHEVGLPKEDVAFWARLHAIEPFMRERTLFVDDSVGVLRAARAYGIHHLCAVLRPDTQQPARVVTEFPAIRDFSELMPVG